MADEDQLGKLLLEREWRTCCPDWQTSTPEELADAFATFCGKYWMIEVPGRGFEPFELRWYQRETVLAWTANRYNVTLKARQIGFSTLASAYIFWLGFFYESRSIIVLSATLRDAKELLQKTKFGYRRLPGWLKARGPALSNDHQLEMRFTNDSRLESLPSKNDPARGRSPFLVIIDEMGLLPNSEEAWAAVKPTVDIGGSLICLGTAKGSGNLFHRLYTGAENGTNEFAAQFYPWDVVPHRDADWYEAESQGQEDWFMAQEYPSNPEEAFLRSGRSVFNLDVLRNIEADEYPARGYLAETEDGVQFVEDGGALRLWKRPQPKHVYVIGADVAEGLKHGDFSSAHVIDVRTHEVVAHWHGKTDVDSFGSDVLDLLGRWYGKALLGVEVNNQGLTTIKALQRANYPNLYRVRKEVNRRAEQTEQVGWRTTMTTKPVAVHELNGALRDGHLGLPCSETIAELMTFVREDNGKMNGSPHDDRVMSLAIANQMLKWAFAPEFTVSDKPGPGTFGALVEKLKGNGSKRFMIGQDAVRG